MQTSVVIMAGGKGERFWPKSRLNMPKQFLSLTGDGKTMLQLTAERALELADIDKIFIVTNRMYKDLVLSQLPDLPPDNVLCEPYARNTAPCAAFAASIAEKKIGESVMTVMPSDHLVKDTQRFTDIMKNAASAALPGVNIVTVGIVPEYPETGYGYINFEKDALFNGCHKVIRFVEKPDAASAEEYIRDGRYLWNSGIFVWKTSLILDKFRELMPDVYGRCVRIGEAYGSDAFDGILAREFEAMPSESIDYGIMEKTENILTIPADFGWNDVGSWLALEKVNKCDGHNNMIQGNCVGIDISNCTIVGSDRLIAAVGLRNVVIVDTDDALLICDKNHTQDVKKIVSELKKNNKKQYL